MDKLFQRSHVVLGPTMSQTEKALIQYEAGSTEVKELQEKFHNKVEQLAYTLPQDILNEALQFTDTVEEYCEKIESRGVKVDEKRFNTEISKAIQVATKDLDKYRSTQLENIQRNLHEAVSPQGVVYPKLTSLSSITGRINVREPALQNWPSALRRALGSVDLKKKYTFSLDFNAFDPTVLAVLSRDPNLIDDLETGDFYSHLATLMGIDTESDDKQTRPVIKRLFISVFINGADGFKFLENNWMLHLKPQWDNIINQRYQQAQQYIDDVNTGQAVKGLDGIERAFRSDDSAAFSKFIQAQAAYIFKHMLIGVEELSLSSGYEVLLPVHDALIIGTESKDTARAVKQKMIEQFKEATGKDFAMVTIEQFSGKQDDKNGMER